MENKIKYGFRNVYYAIKNGDTYDTPVKLAGAINVDLSPEGDETKFYADDITYYSTTANNGYAGTLEQTMLQDKDKVALLGQIMDEDGLLVETADDIQAEFALLYEVQGDITPTRYCLYNCKVARSGEKHETKAESVNPTTEPLSLAAMAQTLGGKNIIKSSVTYSDTTAAKYNDWFTDVTIPNFATI